MLLLWDRVQCSTAYFLLRSDQPFDHRKEKIGDPSDNNSENNNDNHYHDTNTINANDDDNDGDLLTLNDHRELCIFDALFVLGFNENSYQLYIYWWQQI